MPLDRIHSITTLIQYILMIQHHSIQDENGEDNASSLSEHITVHHQVFFLELDGIYRVSILRLCLSLNTHDSCLASPPEMKMIFAGSHAGAWEPANDDILFYEFRG